MNAIRTCTLATTLLFLALHGTPAAASDPALDGALATPANRVVGLWSNQSLVGPCGGTPAMQGRNTVIFIAGGTLVDNPRTAAGTATQRSIGLGTWSYAPATGRYSQRVQFDWFVNGAYDGYQTIDRDFVLTNGGSTASGPVVARRYNADGSLRAELCGSATSTRL